MGKFAAVYDIVGGEQMLICVVSPTGQYPHFQVSTEVYGVQSAVTMPVIQDEEEERKKTHEEVKKLALSYLDAMTMDNLLEIRRVMVLELKKQQSPSYLRKIANEQIAREKSKD